MQFKVHTPQRQLVDALFVHLQLAQKGVATGDAETLVEALRTITDLLENPLPLLSSHLPELVTWCMQIASTAEQPLIIRQTSLQVMSKSSVLASLLNISVLVIIAAHIGHRGSSLQQAHGTCQDWSGQADSGHASQDVCRTKP